MGQEIGITTIKPIEKKPIILEELCSHLELQRGQSNFGVVSISPDGVSTHYLEVDRYHCKLTNKPCVGVFQDGNTGGDLVNSETVLRCPSRRYSS